MHPLMVSEVGLGSSTESLPVICDSESEVHASSYLFSQYTLCNIICMYIIHVCCLSRSVLSDFIIPRTIPARLLCTWRFSRQEYWSGLPCLPLGHLPNPGIKCRTPALQRDSLPAEPPGKPKNTGVGSLSLLQGKFPTQELNWGLLHCREILSR